MIEDYFAYELAIGRDYLGPLLLSRGVDLQGKRVLDVGCGYGGVLEGLLCHFPQMQAVGLDRDEAMIGSGRARAASNLDLRAGDFFEFTETPYDFLLLRDVLEHIGDYGAALHKAKALLKPQGKLFASFAPFGGPFGGHQHNGTGLFSRLPWVHCLPPRLFWKGLSVRGNSYKGSAALSEDMRSVFATRLSVAGFDRACRLARLRPIWQRFFLSRPEYRKKFGWPTVALPNWPILWEKLCTGVEVLAGVDF